MFEKVFIVAGHGGGGDPGAVAADGTTERAIVKAICEKLIPMIGDRAIAVGVNNGLSITRKTEVVNGICDQNGWDYKNSLLVSVHADWRGAREGVGAYHYTGYRPSEYFAEHIVSDTAETTDRKFLYNWPDSRSRDGRIGIIQDTRPLAVLIETGSLRADNNEGDGLELLKSEDGQQKIAEAMARGIHEYAGWDMPEPPVEVAAIDTSDEQDIVSECWEDLEKIKKRFTIDIESVQQKLNDVNNSLRSKS